MGWVNCNQKLPEVGKYIQCYTGIDIEDQVKGSMLEASFTGYFKESIDELGYNIEEPLFKIYDKTGRSQPITGILFWLNEEEDDTMIPDWNKVIEDNKTTVQKALDQSKDEEIEETTLFKIFESLEEDPYGLQPSEPGAKLDSGKNRLGLVLGAFGNALMAVGAVGTFGANKYSSNGWLAVPKGRERYTDAMLRHYFYESTGETIDPDSNLAHSAHLAWNALARLELEIREYDANI
jgi:hypothetical protein